MKSIKTLIISLAGYLLLSLPSAAQPAPCAPGPVPPDPQNKEKLESARIAYFTSRMDLTPDEAAKFWPVYKEYRKAMDAARSRFEQAVDPLLIDCFIYELNAAQLKYQFLLRNFKKVRASAAGGHS